MSLVSFLVGWYSYKRCIWGLLRHPNGFLLLRNTVQHHGIAPKTLSSMVPPTTPLHPYLLPLFAISTTKLLVVPYAQHQIHCFSLYLVASAPAFLHQQIPTGSLQPRSAPATSLTSVSSRAGYVVPSDCSHDPLVWTLPPHCCTILRECKLVLYKHHVLFLSLSPARSKKGRCPTNVCWIKAQSNLVLLRCITVTGFW